MYNCSNCNLPKAEEKFTYHEGYREGGRTFIKEKGLDIPLCQDCIDKKKQERKIASLISYGFLILCGYFLFTELLLTRAAIETKLIGLFFFALLGGVTIFASVITFRSDDLLFAYFIIKKIQNNFLNEGFTKLYADYQVENLKKTPGLQDVQIIDS